MNPRAQGLAERLDQATQEAIATVEGLTDAQWNAPGQDEGRTIGVTAHHVAVSYPTTVGLVQAIANGMELPAISMDMIHAANAQHARQAAGATKAEVLELLRTNGPQTAETLRGLSDEQLDRTGVVAAFGNQPVSAEQVAEMIVIGHVGMHLKDIRTAAAKVG